MGNRHTLSDEHFDKLIQIWCREHNAIHIQTIELTPEEAALYEQETAT